MPCRLRAADRDGERVKSRRAFTRLVKAWDRRAPRRRRNARRDAGAGCRERGMAYFLHCVGPPAGDGDGDPPLVPVRIIPRRSGSASPLPPRRSAIAGERHDQHSFLAVTRNRRRAVQPLRFGENLRRGLATGRARPIARSRRQYARSFGLETILGRRLRYRGPYTEPAATTTSQGPSGAAEPGSGTRDTVELSQLSPRTAAAARDSTVRDSLRSAAHARRALIPPSPRCISAAASSRGEDSRHPR